MSEELMTQEHADWIDQVLCPFILREQGRGFGMECWSYKWPAGSSLIIDDVQRPAPSCETIACIGGSIAFLKKLNEPGMIAAGRAIGLTAEEAYGLFLHWSGARYYGWPEGFQSQYAVAKTALEKAEVAVALLHEVARTRGKILHSDWTGD